MHTDFDWQLMEGACAGHSCHLLVYCAENCITLHCGHLHESACSKLVSTSSSSTSRCLGSSGRTFFQRWLLVEMQTSAIAASVSDAWLHLACRYNAELFGSKLPEDLHISWSTKLKTTAGLTHFKRSTSSDGTVT